MSSMGSPLANPQRRFKINLKLPMRAEIKLRNQKLAYKFIVMNFSK